MRRFLVTSVIATTLMTLGAAATLAAEVTVEPVEVPAGPAELWIEVADFGPYETVFLLPCDATESDKQLGLTSAFCDVGSVVTTKTDENGAASIRVVWEVPETGLTLYVGDAARRQQVTRTVGATGEATTADVVVLGTTVVEEELADSGPREILALLMTAIALVGTGLTFTTLARARVRA